MKWYEAVAEMQKDPTKEFTANGWAWKLVHDILWARRIAGLPGAVPANVSAEDQSKDWTLVIPPPKEYTFKEMVKELLTLGHEYYGVCITPGVSNDKLRISGMAGAVSSFLHSDYDGLFTLFITDDTLRFHIKPKE